MPPGDNIPYTGPKHPERIIIDHSKPSERVPLSANSKTLWAYNKQGSYQQGDSYVDGSSTGTTTKYTDLIAIEDFARKETYPLGNVYFETNKTDLATADSKYDLKDSNLNDAAGYIKAQAAELVKILTKEGNENFQVAVTGHASWKGDHQHNQDLSNDRAKAVSEALIAEVNRLDPTGKLAARIHQTTAGMGDRLADQTQNDLKNNRNVSIEVVTQNVAAPNRVYELVHLDKGDMEKIQTIGDGSFTFDLNGSTGTGQALKDKYSLELPVPAHGAVILESTDVKNPLNINISSQQADDFRLLVADTKSKIGYQVNEDNTVSVTANDKTIAILHYDAKDGPVKAESIHVGTVDATGLTKVVARDFEGEQKTAAAKADALKAKLVVVLSTSQDGKIHKEVNMENVAAYAKNMVLREKLSAADPNKDGLDVVEVKVMGQRMQNGMEGPQYQSMTAEQDFANAVRQLGGEIAGNPVMSLTQIEQAKKMDEMFRTILADGGFDVLKNGPLPCDDMTKSINDVTIQHDLTNRADNQAAAPVTIRRQ